MVSISPRQYPRWPLYRLLREDKLVVCRCVRDTGEEHQLGSDSIYRNKRTFPMTLVVAVVLVSDIGGSLHSPEYSVTFPSAALTEKQKEKGKYQR